MNLRYLLLLLLPLLFATCEDDDDATATATADISINFRGEYNERPLEIQSATYSYPTGDELKVLRFQYYVSDLSLIDADGQTVPLSEIDLIRYETAGDAAEESREFTVPAGTYTGLRFGLGVKPELNATDPNAFAADFVLNENEFWNPRARYVFAKVEANAKLADSDRFDTGLTYHMGSDALYTELRFDRNFDLSDGSSLTLVADVLQALADSGETFDIRNPDQQQVHGGNQNVATDIWNRLASQFELRID